MAEPGRRAHAVRAASNPSGIHGNGHEMMLEKNSDEIAKFIADWMAKNVPEEKVNPRTAMPPSSIPTFSTENIARQAFFYAGGQYVGPKGKEVMGDAMYTEVWVPRQPQASLSHRFLPRQRPDRRGLAADAGRTRGLGLLLDGPGLHRLHGGLSGAWTLRLRPGWRARWAPRTSAPRSISNRSGRRRCLRAAISRA